MDTLSISAVSVKRNSTVSSLAVSRGGSRGSGLSSSSGSRTVSAYRMDGSPEGENTQQPVFTKLTATRCYRPKEWTPEVEEAFRVQQTGWRDLKEYMEKYGEPDRWENGFIRCTRVKSNGYYTYWRAYRECEDKYMHGVKLFEYS